MWSPRRSVVMRHVWDQARRSSQRMRDRRYKAGHRGNHHAAAGSQTLVKWRCPRPWHFFALCSVRNHEVPAVNEVSLKNSKSLRLIFTGPTSGYPAEVIGCQGPEHTNWPYFPWAAWPGASSHALCLPQELHVGSGLCNQPRPPVCCRCASTQPCPTRWVFGTDLGLCLLCLMITVLSGELVAITLLPCSPCLGSVGQCSGQWGLYICLCHGHLWFLVDFPLWNNSVPVAPWLLPSGFIPGRDGHVQRQFCTQMGLNGTLGIGTLGIGFLLSPQRTPRKTGSSNYLVCRSCRDRMEYVGRK